MISYSVEKRKKDNMYVVYKNVETERGIGFKGLFSSKKASKCYQYKKELEEKTKADK